jgi:predicted nuclease with RNAse H fold
VIAEFPGGDYDEAETEKIMAFHVSRPPPYLFRGVFSMQKRSLRVVGIDLAGSHKRPTGFCFLERNRAEVSVLHTDEEILRAVGKGVHAVAVDAPLSLPRGRCCLRDDCPCAGKAHFRACDLELRAMKIKFFPITLGPMRQLTVRGLRLKESLERKGIEVFETYPGAAQDIWGVPRQKDPAGLKRGAGSI